MRAQVAVLALSLVLLVPTAAVAETITVNTTEDVSVSQCTLRNAIRAANFDAVEGGCAAGSGADTIQFSLPPESTIVLASKLPTLNSVVEIVGPGVEEVVISGGDAVAAFAIGSSTTKISDLTIAHTVCPSGCAISNSGTLSLTNVALADNEATIQGGANAFPSAGAIYNNGSLEIADSDITGNFVRAIGASSQNVAEGGAITNFLAGDLTIVDSTLEGNHAVAEAAPTASSIASGGAISNYSKLAIRGSTLSENSASGTGSSADNRAYGGALVTANSPSVEVTIERSTISGNGAVVASPISLTGGGGISSEGGTFELSSSTVVGNSAALAGANLRLGTGAVVRSTIVAEPLGGAQSCGGAGYVSQGFNLDEGTSCGFNQATDQSATDPLLSATGLADNGGPTETIALEAGSPAIDQGHAAAGEGTDQRELTRPVDIASVADAIGGDGTDVGAFEVQIPATTILTGPAQGATIAEAEPTFTFSADEAGATFQCAIDGGPAQPCASPYKLPALGNGAHTFSVFGLNGLGYAGAAETRAFSVHLSTGGGEGTTGNGGDGAGNSSGGGASGGGSSGGPTSQATAPETTLSALPAKTRKRHLSIRFTSSQPGSTFACKLDAKPWRACASPYRTPKLAFGKHVFRVRATSAGLTDASPAKKAFQVLRPQVKKP